MTRLGLAIALSAPAFLIAASASRSGAQERAPVIRVYSQTGAIASNYVTPSIDVGEDAYVFAVSIDLDGQIQVLHPDFPGISVRLRRHQEFRLPNFFAGFSQNGGVVASDYYANRSVYSDMDDTRGVVIALASRQPFNLERVESDGDWNMLAIRNLVDRRSPSSAAEALASYLGAKGEPIGRDFMRFASAHQNYYAGYLGDELYGCDPFYGSISPGLAFSRLAVLQRFRQFRSAGGNARLVGFDLCGMPIIAYGRSGFANAPPRRPPRTPGDSGKSKEGRGFPRHMPIGEPAAPRAALGYFPRTKTLTPPQAGDVTITAPTRISRSAGEILIDRRNQPATGVMPERTRIPVERTVPSSAAATGTQPVRQFTPPTPRENAPMPRAQPTQSSSPPPPPPRYNPPPATSSPPPRVESKPVTSPPPRQ